MLACLDKASQDIYSNLTLDTNPNSSAMMTEYRLAH